MTSLHARLERLEQKAPPSGPYAGLSSEELTATLLEIRAALLRHPLETAERARILAGVKETKAELESWAEYWARPDVSQRLPSGYVPPLIGNGAGDRPDEVARRPSLRARAEIALQEIERIAA